MRSNLVLALLCLSTYLASASISPSCLNGYNFYQQITFQSAGSVQNDFQFSATLDTATLVSSGVLSSSGFNVLFTDATGCTKYCFSFETGTFNTNSTVVWIRVPGANSNTATVLWVYGNETLLLPDATQSPSCTFDSYVDFLEGLGPWTTCNPNVSISSSGNLELSWAPYGGVYSNFTLPLGTIWTVEAYVANFTGYWPGLYVFLSDKSAGYGLITGPGYGIVPSYSESGLNSHLDCSLTFNWNINAPDRTAPLGLPSTIFSISWVSNATQDYRWYHPSGQLVFASNASADYSYFLLSQPLTIYMGGIWDGGGAMSVTWVRARKYAPAGSITTTISAAQTVPRTSAAGKLESYFTSLLLSLLSRVQFWIGAQ